MSAFTPATASQGFERDHARAPKQRKPLPPALRLVFGLILLIICGTLLLMMPFVGTERSLYVSEALFTATSALTVTGLSVIVPVRDLTIFGQIILLGLIQIGGVGFMVTAVLAFRVLGRRVSLIDRLALSDSLGLIVPGAILKLTRRVFATVLIIEGIGALLLWLYWRGDDRLTPQQAVFFSIFHAVSAFCNAGFDLFSSLPGYRTGIPKDNYSLIVLGLLIFLGGLGIPVLADFLTWPRDHRFSLHTKITLLVVAFLIIAGTVGIFFAEGRAEVGALRDEPWQRRLLISWFQSISARTAGFAGVPRFQDVTPATEMLLITLMFIGCAPASMGGGITTGTFAILTLSLWGYARGLPSPQFAGRRMAPGMVRKAAAVLTISLLIVLLATWLLLMTHSLTLDRALFEVVSAFATCGLSLGVTGKLNLFGQIVIVFVMFWGRLGALTIVIALAQQQSKQIHHVTYPEEQILIG